MLATFILWLGGVLDLLYQALWWHPLTDVAKLYKEAIGSAFKYVPTRRPDNEFRVGGPWVRVRQSMECSILGIAVGSCDEEPRHGPLFDAQQGFAGQCWAEKFLQRPSGPKRELWISLPAPLHADHTRQSGKPDPLHSDDNSTTSSNPVSSQSLPISHSRRGRVEKEASLPPVMVRDPDRVLLAPLTAALLCTCSDMPAHRVSERRPRPTDITDMAKSIINVSFGRCQEFGFPSSFL
jgi:hypothetical protein